MKRTILQIVAVFGVFSATVACQAEDSLFSHTPINSVFAQPGVGGANGPAGGQMPEKRPPMRITGAPELAALVSQAGLDPKAVSENVVSTKIHHQSWSFPALVTTTDDRSQVVLVLLLSVVKDDQQLPAAKLLELMNANRDHAPAFFAFSAKRKRVELHRTLDNSGVTSEQLREEINRLAEIAASTQSLWKVAETPTAKTDSAPKAAPQPTTSAGR
jgi:hypothetical protein